MPQLDLHGDFVDLLPLTPEHAELTHGWRQSQRAAHLNPGAATARQQATWIATRPASEYNFIIALKTGLPVGMVSLTGIDSANRHAEPGRFLIGDDKAVRGVPVAVEAMKMVYELAFDGLNLNRVWGMVAGDNVLMIKWQKFLGMKEEGRLRGHYLRDGCPQDAVVFGLLANEFKSEALPRMKALIKAGRPRSTA